MFSKHLAMTSPYPVSLDVERAAGSRIYTTDSKDYIDLVSGIGVTALGHQHPVILSAIREQLERHMHVMVYGEFAQEAQNKLANRLNEITPSSIDQFYLTNSGTEANEAAIKLVKRVTGRTEIIALHGSYHGSTNGSLSISGNESRKSAFRPLIPDVKFISLNNIPELTEITERTGGVFIETIQGDAGVRIPDSAYMTALYKRCKEVGALLVTDEIQCGFGRTGKWWAFEHYPIVPDIVTMGKALGGGMPIGCVGASQELLSQFTHNPVLGHISTFAGHPLIAAAGAAAIEVVQNEQLIEQVDNRAQIIRETLSQLPGILEVRSKGLMFGVTLASAEHTEKVIKTALENQLLLFYFLSCRDSFRIAPSLNISDKDLKDGLKRLEKTFYQVFG